MYLKPMKKKFEYNFFFTNQSLEMLKNFVFLLIFIFSSFNCFSNETIEKTSHGHHKSISKIIANKVYVRDDAIKVDKNGIFI